MEKILLDTNILIYFLKEERKALELIHRLAKPPLISSISILELYHGAKSLHDELDINELLDYGIIVSVDRTIAKRAGKLLQEKRKQGIKSFHKEDMVIAATALEQDATLVTANWKDFQNIAGLKLEKFIP
jgi:predicted nucleic acid-binding protein